MKIRIINAVIFTFLFGMLFSCEKENITNAYFDDHPDRQEKIKQEVKRVLASAENGWVMMVKPNLKTETHTPIVLKFDTLTNRVDVKTVYGMTDYNESYFRIATGTGTPQLSFTTGSIISTLYRMGSQASDITDHIFNIVDVKSDTLTIQSYRSGGTGTKEGGVIHKLFKRPDSWKWADDDILFDYRSPNFVVNLFGASPLGEMTLRYASDNSTIVTPWRFSSWPESTIFRIQTNDPFSFSRDASRGGFLPIYSFIITAINGGGLRPNATISPVLGHNAISLLPFPSDVTTNELSRSLGELLKTHYLVFKGQERTGRNIKMEFEAYNFKGETVVSASYNNRL